MNLYMRLTCNKSVCFSNLRAQRASLREGGGLWAGGGGSAGSGAQPGTGLAGPDRGSRGTGSDAAKPPSRHRPTAGRARPPRAVLRWEWWPADVPCSRRVLSQARWPPGVTSSGVSTFRRDALTCGAGTSASDVPAPRACPRELSPTASWRQRSLLGVVEGPKL